MQSSNPSFPDAVQPGTAPRSIAERYAGTLAGRLVCYDRLLIYGTLQRLHNPATVAGMLQDRGLTVFEIKKLCEPWTAAIKANAMKMAEKHGQRVRFVLSCKERKEDIVKA